MCRGANIFGGSGRKLFEGVAGVVIMPKSQVLRYACPRNGSVGQG